MNGACRSRSTPATTMEDSEKPSGFPRCNSLSKTVAHNGRRRRADAWSESWGLYARDGARKYLNEGERRRLLAAIRDLPADRALFALTLAWTGARVSEVLALTPASFQVERAVVAISTLKRRRHLVREVPIPPSLMEVLDRHFGIAAAQAHPERAARRLWPWNRVTAWRLIKRVAAEAGIAGPRASPRGLRHSFAIGALQSGVPINLVQRLLGHAQLATTAIYADACGAEEVAFVARFWRCGEVRGGKADGAPAHGIEVGSRKPSP